jgi:arylsulfatase A
MIAQKIKTIFTVAALAFAGQLFAGNKPNIVLIVADDMSWADVGCYGNQDVKTPTLDALAKEGLRFTHCLTTSAGVKKHLPPYSSAH